MSALFILLILICCHFVCDFAWQSDAMAREKSRHSTTELQKHVPWYHWLTGHAFIHALPVLFFLGNLWLGLAEIAAHWLTDYLKCEKKIGIHTDQAIHIGCKILWVAIVYYL